MTDLRGEYAALRDKFLTPCSLQILERIQGALVDIPRVDRVSGRVKASDRFLVKAAKLENDQPKYKLPCIEIQDLIGVRIVVLFLEDVVKVQEGIMNYFRQIEARALEPESSSEFSYFGWHAVLMIPEDCKPDNFDPPTPRYFELQVKTVFQHAWSEAEHDIGYKPMSGELRETQKREIAFAASLAWGADRAFQDVRDKLSGEQA